MTNTRSGEIACKNCTGFEMKLSAHYIKINIHYKMYWYYINKLLSKAKFNKLTGN